MAITDSFSTLSLAIRQHGCLIIFSNKLINSTLCMCNSCNFTLRETKLLLGMQSGVILAAQPYGLGLNETLIPQYLKEFGYATHGVGKVWLEAFIVDNHFDELIYCHQATTLIIYHFSI